MSFSDLTDSAIKACRDAFGEAVSYTPSGESAAAIVGIFNAQSIEIDGGVPVLSKNPSLGIRKADLAADFEPTTSDTVFVRSVTYRVTDWVDDGEGGLSLQLQRDA